MPSSKHITWIVVADGARAFIAVNEGPGTGLTLVPGSAQEHELQSTTEMGSERPGRSFASARSGTRHSIEPRVDWHRFEKEKFAHGIAKLLDAARVRKAFHHLVLVAPPKTLGELRAALDKQTQAMVTSEVAKDLTRHPIDDLPSHLEGVIKV